MKKKTHLIKEKFRKNWIDGLRAFAIILVVLGHQLKGVTWYFIFTSPIKMPLFFAISGYLFSTKNFDDRAFFKNWFIKLILPWFGLAFIPMLPNLLSGRVGVCELMMNLISGKMLWFMPCFVVAEVIHYYIRKFSKTESSVIVLSLIITMYGFWANHIGILNFAMINRAFIVQSFFLMGYIFKSHENLLTNISWKMILCSSLLYVILCGLGIFLFGFVAINVHSNNYFNIPYCFVLISLGLYTLFTAASKSQYSNKALSIIGKNTLLLYIWHKQVITIFVFLLSHLSLTITNIYISAIFKTLWAIVICNVLARYINLYIPELVGKKRD